MLITILEQLKNIDAKTASEVKSCFDDIAINYRFSGSIFFDWVKNEKTDKIELLYKNQVAAKGITNIQNILPEFQNSKFLEKNKRPYFVFDLLNIRRAIDEGEAIAIEGGPCLFGQDEVIVVVTLNDDSKHTFDYSTGRKSDSVTENILSSELELYDFIMSNAESVKDISYINNKKNITIDEYDSLDILFDFATCLKCPLVIPIVDMSYQKYIEFATRNIDSIVRNKAINDFRNIVYSITDLYIGVIEGLSKIYPNVEYKVLHDRANDLMGIYYEKRAPFIERKKVIHSLTDVEIRLEPIKDYCTMAALPYYFYGIKNILQVDCLDETDSHRKCKRAHRNTLAISALLYPEKVYENGMTMFNAPLGDKKYIGEIN